MDKKRNQVYLNLYPTEKEGCFEHYNLEKEENYSEYDDDLVDISIKDLLENEEINFSNYDDFTSKVTFQSTEEQEAIEESAKGSVRNVAIAHDTVVIDLKDEKKKNKWSFKSWLKSIIPTKRRLIQLYAALLTNANLRGFISGFTGDDAIFQGKSKYACAPGINCYSCPGAIGSCPLGTLQNELKGHSIPYYIFGIIFLYSILFGRFICGWLCPFGLVQDLLHKIKTPKIKKSGVTRVLSYFKYVVLVLFVFVFTIFGVVPAFCKYICPAGILEGALALLPIDALSDTPKLFSMLGPSFTWKFSLFVCIAVACIFMYRVFCRFICPLGAIYSLFNKVSFFGIKLNKHACTNCGRCISKCKVDIKHVGDHECISCGECIDVCPTKAISWKGPKIFVAPNEISIPENAGEKQAERIMKKNKEEAEKAKKKNTAIRIVIASVMAVVLIGTLLYANVIHPMLNKEEDNTPPTTQTPPSGNPDLVVGNKVGNLCPSYELSLFDGNGIKETKFDPSKTGKVTVINFWGKWCTSCVAELPYFDSAATEYSDDIVVVAVHTHDGFDDGIGYVESNYKSSDMVFVKDDPAGNDEAYYKLLGGAYFSYPFTVILDENGVITFSQLGSVTEQQLIGEIEKALNK